MRCVLAQSEKLRSIAALRTYTPGGPSSTDFAFTFQVTPACAAVSLHNAHSSGTASIRSWRARMVFDAGSAIVLTPQLLQLLHQRHQHETARRRLRSKSTYTTTAAPRHKLKAPLKRRRETLQKQLEHTLRDENAASVWLLDEDGLHVSKRNLREFVERCGGHDDDQRQRACLTRPPRQSSRHVVTWFIRGQIGVAVVGAGSTGVHRGRGLRSKSS